MYKSNQTTNNVHVAMAPWAAAICLVLAMLMNPSGAFALGINPYPSWEVASEFNDCSNINAVNPSGVWSYGEKPSEFGTFTLLTACATSYLYTGGTFPDISGWTNASGYPQVAHNTHAITLSGPGLLGTQPPHGLYLHPGAAGEHAVVRFTAPTKGTYRVSGQFYANDKNGNGTITDVYIVQNNTSQVFASNVNYYANQRFASFTSIPVTLNAGEYIEFQVGFGTDLSYAYDSTGLNAVIEKIR